MLAPLVRRRRTIAIGVAFLVTVSLLLAIAHFGRRVEYELPWGFGSVIADRKGLHQKKQCADDLDYLRRNTYGLSNLVKHQRICVHPHVSDNVDRMDVKQIPSPTFGAPDQRVLNLSKKCQTEPPTDDDTPCQTLNLDVSKPYPKQDYSEIVFAVATQLNRLRDSLPVFKHWLADTNATMVSIVQGEVSDRELKTIRKEYAKAGIKLVTTRPEDPGTPGNAQHFTMLRTILKKTTPHEKWIGIIDDDTFFPSLYPVKEVLKKYDASQNLYLGDVSESSFNIKVHGYMAFGGGGAFITRPLASTLEPEIDNCMKEIPGREGDHLLSKCIYKKTDTNLTQVPGLHQLDMGGDVSGFYESGRLPLSLHHWKSWHRVAVGEMAEVAQFCGDCIMQRWKLGDNAIFTNGYSLAEYPQGTKDLDLSKLEATWALSEFREHWKASFGELRDKLDGSKKKSYTIIDSERVGDKLRQVYLRRAPTSKDEEENEKRVDEVIEFLWDWS